MSILERLRSNKGFTLMETLVTVLLLALITAVVLIGVQAIQRVYVQDTFSSQSQIVSDTINRALSDVLRYATNIRTDDNGVVTSITNTNYGIVGETIQVGTGTKDRGIIYLKYMGEDEGGNIRLLSDLSYSGMMVVPEDYDPGTGGDLTFELYYSEDVFTGSYRLYSPGKRLLSNSFHFSFRALNAG